MLVYLLLFASIPVWNFFLKKRKALLVSIIALELFAVLALRAPTLGVDLDNYSGGYEYISSLSFGDMLSRLNFISPATLTSIHSYESGYVVVNWIISHLGFNFHGFLILYSAFCVYAHARFIYKYSESPWLTFSIFIALGAFGYFFGILRQTIAASIMLFSVDTIRERKPIKFLLYCLLAFTFHRSALVFAPLYIFASFKYNRKTFKRCFWLYVVELFALVLVLKYVIQLIFRIFGKGYTISEFTMNRLMILLFIVFIALYFTLDFKNNSEDANHNLLCAGFWLALYLQMLGVYMEIVSRSFTGYYLIFVALIIPRALENFKKRSKGIVPLASCVIYVGLFGYYILSLRNSTNVPFVPFWQ